MHWVTYIKFIALVLPLSSLLFNYGLSSLPQWTSVYTSYFAYPSPPSFTDIFLVIIIFLGYCGVEATVHNRDSQDGGHSRILRGRGMFHVLHSLRP